MTRLTLLAQAPEDLPALSSLLQDATLRAPDIAYESRRRRLVLLVNRYRWEAPTPSRIRSALRLEAVTAVQHQAWPSDPDAVLALLSLAHHGEHLDLTFAAGPALRARIEVIDLALEDLTEPWPTDHRPRHD